jgi:periplasmic protein TonB
MKSILLLVLVSNALLSFGQQTDDRFYLFDKNWENVTQSKKAEYLVRVRQNTDSDYEWTYYKIFGPRIKRESFKDEKATIPNGRYLYYYEDGGIDSAGKMASGQLNGPWFFYNHKGRIIREKKYDMGNLVKDTTFEVKDDQDQTEIQLKPGESKSEYPGGVGAWQQFLSKNLHYPDRAISAEAMGEVKLQFVVDTAGVILNPEIIHSVEYSLDEESLRIIGLSEKWTPAVQRGRKVKSYKIQPIRFRLAAR